MKKLTTLESWMERLLWNSLTYYERTFWKIMRVGDIIYFDDHDDHSANN